MSHRLLLILLIAANSLGIAALAIYTPSIPDMARELGVPIGDIQRTVTVYFSTFAISMLVVGPLSDRFGRRRVMLTGIGLFTVASVGCMLAPDIQTLLASRAVQGLGACAGVALARAIVRDLFDRNDTARNMAILGGAVTIMPAVAPIVGGYVHEAFGWRANFAILLVVSVALFAAMVLYLPETRKGAASRSMGSSLIGGTAQLLRSPAFLGYALVVAGGAAVFSGFAIAAPVLMIEQFGLSPSVFGLYLAAATIGFLPGAFITNRLVARVGPDRLIAIGATIVILTGLALATLTGYGESWLVALAFFIATLGMGMAVPNGHTGTVSVYPHLAGPAAGLGGFAQTAAAGLATLVVAAVPVDDELPIAILIGLSGLIVLIGILIAVRSPAPPADAS